ncbi:putative toxin-antitoxin system toxin component, PIN family [Pseudanabaena sp. Chao 1811]|uniref:putative toxin-antitoxin system toxin component, PIN family n=1 Tax=Pseudanabaena sp. Chao 1811 TaxID=2963092 RepID=UPI0022F3E101|nr:putative toxin-antitoxin system toxin component, PIN family [Pseudanabaena sp. Chao 1811]
MKVVLDTNVWVSAWLWRGLPNNLIHLARREEIQICISESLLAELENTLSYKKLQQKIQSLNLTKEQLLIGTREITYIYPIEELIVPDLRDPDDTVVLATAIAASVEVIITGDRDLLILQEYQNMQIMTATDFLEQYFSL